MQFARTGFPSSFGNPARNLMEIRYYKCMYMNILGKKKNKMHNHGKVNSIYSYIKIFTDSLTIKIYELH